jgi:hypothetical protein
MNFIFFVFGGSRIYAVTGRATSRLGHVLRTSQWAGRQARTHKNRVRQYSGNDMLTAAASRQKSAMAASTLDVNTNTAFRNHRLTAARQKVKVNLSSCLVKHHANKTYARVLGSGSVNWINLARDRGQ